MLPPCDAINPKRPEKIVRSKFLTLFAFVFHVAHSELQRPCNFGHQTETSASKP
jgi:hypothetical protein